MTVGALLNFYDEGTLVDRARALDAVDVPLVWDSGAFSAFTRGVTIDRVEHAEFTITEQAICPRARFLALDVIGDYAATLDNYRTQRALGAPVEPTLHYGNPIGLIDDLLAVGPTDWFNVGGVVPYLGSQARNIAAFIAAVRNRLPDEVRIHVLGCMNPDICRLVPFDAADSTKWFYWSKFRTMHLFDRHSARWRNFDPQSWEKAHRYGALLREHGLDPAEVALDDIDYRVCHIAMARSIGVFSDWMSDQWGTMPFCGYLAGATSHPYASDAVFGTNFRPDRAITQEAPA